MIVTAMPHRGFSYHNKKKLFATSEEAAFPMDLAAEIAAAFKDVLQENRRIRGELDDLRAKWFATWVSRARELAPDEVKLKNSLPPHLKRILEPKRSLLLVEILNH